MQDHEIAHLKKELSTGKEVFWCPNDSTCHKILRIGAAPKEEIPEPSECAYTAKGFVALWNAPTQDFIIGTRFTP